MIIGTAGHIDHGKTSLVRALTGVNTDRLPEEQRRGMSIELGYAYLALPDGRRLGFVDVPGHERFIHTMLAGASGMDLALLVVAADDGVMPQTREHVQLLDLLGVSRMAVVLSKIDRVDRARCAAVEAQVQSLLGATRFAHAPLLPASAHTGEGVETVLGWLSAQAAPFNDALHAQQFRLPIDRVFTLSGQGTVVAGAVFSGRVRVGDTLWLAPAGRTVRVRSLHAQNRTAEDATLGERCALQVSGITREEARRGDWLVADGAVRATRRIDIALQVVADAPTALKSGAAVQVFLGTGHTNGRVVLLAATQLEPGESGLAQLVLDEAILAWNGDRLVLRDAAARRPLAGAQVRDPAPPARYRGTSERLALLAALGAPTERQRVAEVVARAATGVDLGWLACSLNLKDPAALLTEGTYRRVTTTIGDWVFAHPLWLGLRASVLDRLARHHVDKSDEPGLTLLALRRAALPRSELAIFRALVIELLGAGELAQSGAFLHLPQHRVRLNSEDERLAEQILPLLRSTPYDPPWVRDLARTLVQPEVRVRDVMRKMARRAQLFQVVRDLFYHPQSIDELQGVCAGLNAEEGEVRAARFRDATGLGRKRSIQILEYFDGEGFTRRVKDRHLLRISPGTGSRTV